MGNEQRRPILARQSRLLTTTRWHADIKPDNILVVQGKFKLADPGFVKFVKKTNEEPREQVMGGTETYGMQFILLIWCSAWNRLTCCRPGAPECYPGRVAGILNAVPQTIDIWSLGCVFSIAATWVVLSYQGIRSFSKLREKAIADINRERSLRSNLMQGSAPIRTASDSFHDGAEVLRDVTSWHSALRCALRATDTITSQVLDLVDGKMLLGDSSKRLKAKDICQELKRILSQSQSRPKKVIPESIIEFLIKVDGEAPSKSGALADVYLSLIVPQDRKTRKSKLLQLPLMKTTHRSEYLKSASSAQVAEPEEKQTAQQSPRQQDVSMRHQAPQGSVLMHTDHVSSMRDLRNIGGGYFASMPLPASALVRHKQQQRSRTAPPQNVFQARDAIEKREKGNLLKRTRKDELLTRHFSNRDIVSSDRTFGCSFAFVD
jgi:serine/threonine protein kinase